MKQLGFFVGREVGGQALETVPQDIVAAGNHIHGKIGLEHATIRAKLLDGMVVVLSRRQHQLFRVRRPVLFVPGKAIQLHIDAAQLGHHVLATGQRRNILLPLGEIRIPPACVRADAKGAAKMIQNDAGVGKGLGQFRQFTDLRVVAPAFKAHVMARQMGEALAEIILLVQMLRRIAAGIGYVGGGIPGTGVANAAKAPAARNGMRGQHRRHVIAQAQIRMADDTGGDTGLAILSAGAHGRDAVDEFGLAKHPQGCRAIGLDHGAAFDEDGGNHVMAAIHIGQDLVQQIAVGDPAVHEIPKMMMRIADWQFRIQSLFRNLCQPIGIR